MKSKILQIDKGWKIHITLFRKKISEKNIFPSHKSNLFRFTLCDTNRPTAFLFTQTDKSLNLHSLPSELADSLVVLSFRMTTLSTDSATRHIPVQHFAITAVPSCTASISRGWGVRVGPPLNAVSLSVTFCLGYFCYCQLSAWLFSFLSCSSLCFRSNQLAPSAEC